MSSLAPELSDQIPQFSEVPIPIPSLPDYVEHINPPPSYEEVIGYQTQTSVNYESPSNLPPLAYVDIMPRMLNKGNVAAKLAPQFDKFSFVIEAANQWLKNKSELSVWKCETVERKVETGLTIDMDSMVIHHSAYGFNAFIIGIRMWLINKTSQCSPQQIGLLNIVPEKTVSHAEYLAALEHLMKVHPLYRNITPLAHGITSHPIYRSLCDAYATYDGINETIAKLNSKLQGNPIPGTILNVESSQIKSSEGDTDPDVTVYTSRQKSKRTTEILRIFYILGPPTGEVICLQECYPLMKKQAQLSTPATWQHWPEVIDQIRTWIINTKGVRVINIQTHDARISKSLGNTEIVTDCTEVLQSEFSGNDFIKIIRLFYTTSAIQSQPVQDLSSKLFLPVRLGRRLFEGMLQTMSRIEAWLRLTGLPIYNVETVHFKLEDAKVIGADTEKCTWTENPNTATFYITAIRGNTIREHMVSSALQPKRVIANYQGTRKCRRTRCVISGFVIKTSKVYGPDNTFTIYNRIYFPCSCVEPRPDRPQTQQQFIPVESACCSIS